MDLNYEPLSDELSLEMQEACKGVMPAGQVVIDPPGVVLTTNFKNYAQRIRDFKVREDDLWVISFPKSGTTWTLEMVWLLKNNINFEKAKSEYQHIRCPFLEYAALWNEGHSEPDTIHITDQKKSPRIIKTHLPVELLPKEIWTKKPKIIYITRNPNDVAISYFHHFRLWNNYSGSQDLFLRAFVNDKVVFAPYWKHVLSYWRLRSQEYLLIIAFEDMKKDLGAVLKRVADFLEVSYTKDQEIALLDHLSFARMKENKAVNFEDDIRQMKLNENEPFIREGKVGTWKKVLSPEFSKQFEQWTKNNLIGSDYPVNVFDEVSV